MDSDLHHILYIGEANPGGESSAESKAHCPGGKGGISGTLRDLRKGTAPAPPSAARSGVAPGTPLWHSAKFCEKIFFQKWRFGRTFLFFHPRRRIFRKFFPRLFWPWGGAPGISVYSARFTSFGLLGSPRAARVLGPTGPDRTRPNPTEPDRTRPNPTEPDRTRPNPTGPDRTRPNPTGPTGGAGWAPWHMVIFCAFCCLAPRCGWCRAAAQWVV